MDVATLGIPGFPWEAQHDETPQASTAAKSKMGPGKGWLRDYRATALSEEALKGLPAELTVLSWNVHHGFDPTNIIDFLANEDADIILLQDIDIGCGRTQHKDIVKEIATALKLNSFFACCFSELESPDRPPSNQGGGMLGLAVLTKFEFVGASVRPHSVQPFNWEAEGKEYSQPRKGERYWQHVTLQTPLGQLGLFNINLEDQCSSEERLVQLADVLDHCTEGSDPEILAGTFQTASHLWYSPLSTEAQYWESNLWADRELNPGFADAFGEEPTFAWRSSEWLSAWVPSMAQAKADHVRLKGLKLLRSELLGNLPSPGEASAWLSPHLCLKAKIAKAEPDVTVQII